MLSQNNHRIDKNEICVSVAYNFPQENSTVWKWVNMRDEKGLTIEELSSPETTFQYLLNNANEKSPFVFLNSKQKAYLERHYIPDQEDCRNEEGNLLGSIACYRLSLKKSDTVYVSDILSISTYNKQFVSVDDETVDASENSRINAVKENIRKNILPEFAHRINIELCNITIQ